MTNKDINSTLLDATYKDASPTKTVEKIKGILASCGIETEEIWSESGVEHCYSLRVNVKGTVFGVNGKGLTKEFALASGYGELMERAQLGLFGDSSVQKLGHYTAAVGNSEKMSVDDLYAEFPAWYESLVQRLSQLDGSTTSPKELISRYADENNMVVTNSFYNMMSGKEVHLPRELRCLVCGSNGGAAGNSMEEAIVQAISEIIERHHKLTVIKEGVSLPDIPESILSQYKTAYSIITNLRNRGLKVIVKDCSMNKKFPVVCVCYIDPQSGRYHTHFGAYPILEIALERTLTESFQGRNIDKFTSNEGFIYQLKEVSSYKNIYKELKKGNFDKPTDFFVGECKYSYNSNMGFTGGSNSELLSQLVEYFASLGKEILVRNASSLGFPTYNVVIPGYSEIIIHSISQKQSGFANVKVATKALRNLPDATFDDYLLLIMHISEMKKLSALNENLFTFSTSANLAFKRGCALDKLLMSSSLAYVYWGMGNLAKAQEFISGMLLVCKNEDYEFLLGLKRYVSMVLNGDSNEKIKSLLELFHKEETVKDIYTCIDSGANPFERFVLKCDCVSCEGCIASEVCYQKYTSHLISVVHKGASELDFESFVNEISKYKTK